MSIYQTWLRTHIVSNATKGLTEKMALSNHQCKTLKILVSEKSLPKHSIIYHAYLLDSAENRKIIAKVQKVRNDPFLSILGIQL